MRQRASEGRLIPLAAAVLWSAACAEAPSPPPVAAGEAPATAAPRDYRAHCAACHGPEGEGDGPVAPVLTVPPADLTLLSARAGGRFPRERVRSVIDGRHEVRGHGLREMPVWGLSFADRGSDSPDLLAVDARIDALVRHLETLQR